MFALARVAPRALGVQVPAARRNEPALHLNGTRPRRLLEKEHPIVKVSTGMGG